MKAGMIVLICVLVMLVLGCVGLLMLASIPEGGTVKTEYPNLVTLKPENIEVDKDFITGTIKNTTKTNLSFVTINLVTYDGKGNRIEESLDCINNFKAGSSWKFKIFYLEKFDHYELSVE